MGDLTLNFSRKEFTCHCGCGLDTIDIRIVNRLQVVRDIVGLPISVDCGCRCPKHNKDVGGEPESFHLPKNGCLAIDWTILNEPKILGKVCMNLIQNWSGGFHYYPEMILSYGKIRMAFCHLDVGPKRRW
jgi:uncharacterized protein YcbK (DUF882 family)